VEKATINSLRRPGRLDMMRAKNGIEVTGMVRIGALD
jgi:hypothetical protein